VAASLVAVVASALLAAVDSAVVMVASALKLVASALLVAAAALLVALALDAQVGALVVRVAPSAWWDLLGSDPQRRRSSMAMEELQVA